jgi:hypothetical protein
LDPVLILMAMHALAELVKLALRDALAPRTARIAGFTRLAIGVKPRIALSCAFPKKAISEAPRTRRENDVGHGSGRGVGVGCIHNAKQHGAK